MVTATLLVLIVVLLFIIPGTLRPAIGNLGTLSTLKALDTGGAAATHLTRSKKAKTRRLRSRTEVEKEGDACA